MSCSVKYYDGKWDALCEELLQCQWATDVYVKDANSELSHPLFGEGRLEIAHLFLDCLILK